MSSLNKAQVIGHLGNDPEVRYSQSGGCVANFGVATTERWKNKDGEPKESTEWHRVTFFGKLGEIAGQYLKKGSLVYVEGRLQTDKWTDKDGVDRYTTKIIGTELRMLGPKRDGDRQDDGSEAQQRREHRRQQQGQQQGGSAPAPASDPFPDDDIPF